MLSVYKIKINIIYKKSFLPLKIPYFVFFSRWSSYVLFRISNKRSKIRVKRCIFLAHFPLPCENAALMSHIKNDGWQDSEVRLASWNASIRCLLFSISTSPTISRLSAPLRLLCPANFRLSISYGAVESIRAKEEDWWSLIFKKERSSRARGQADWKKSEFPFTRLCYIDASTLRLYLNLTSRISRLMNVLE